VIQGVSCASIVQGVPTAAKLLLETPVSSRRQCSGSPTPVQHRTGAAQSPRPSHWVGRARMAMGQRGGERSLGAFLRGKGKREWRSTKLNS
jgi:hypothetical protein